MIYCNIGIALSFNWFKTSKGVAMCRLILGFCLAIELCHTTLGIGYHLRTVPRINSQPPMSYRHNMLSPFGAFRSEVVFNTSGNLFCGTVIKLYFYNSGRPMHWRESAMWHWTGVWLLRRRGWVWNSLGNCWNEMHLGPAEWRSLHRQWNRAWEVCQKLPGTTCNLLWLKRMLQRSYMQKAISLGSFHHMPGTCSHLCTTWWKL